MEVQTRVNSFLKEHIQSLTKCGISKESLIDGIAYFKSKYIVYFYKHSHYIFVNIYKRYTEIFHLFIDVRLVKFDIIYIKPSKKFMHSGKEVVGKIWHNVCESSL